MPLGTLDRTPPPFFRQGPSALSKLVFFSALALFLMVADARLRWLEPLRGTVAVALLPAQQALAVPVEIWLGGSSYLQGLAAAQAEAAQARRLLAAQADRVFAADSLARENEALRALLGLGAAVKVRSQAAEVMYEAADPFTRKVVIDRGQVHGIRQGAPVINEAGVLGQVTRVFPLSSEVMLLTDRDATIPVLNVRTQQRSIAYGGVGDAGMELRFLSGNADIQTGDELQTSGLDAIYPPGLLVGRVSRVDRRTEGGFARVQMQPAARSEGVRHVLVLEPVGVQLPPPPPPAEAAPAVRSERQLKAPRRDAPAATGGTP